MKPIRLLPVVIFAAVALLLFKGIGLVTNGGYVLTGTQVVMAEGSGSTEPAAGAETMAATPSEATMADANPSLVDTAPTLPTKAEALPEGSHSVAEPSSGEATSPPSTSSGAIDAPADHAAACPGAGAEPASGTGHGATAAASADGCPPTSEPESQTGDAIPTVKDGSGRLVPLDAADGESSETALLQRLGARRDQLDKREADLGMREAVVAAAEKKLEEKTKELADLQAKVSALVDQKQAAEDANFKAIVSMYENMKPKDAAKIFDTLDLGVLVKVAQAMNPRKMSPILAAMSPKPAERLTTAFAVNNSPTPPVNAGENLAALPQIVGH